MHIPAESVYAVFEVKPSMSRALVRDAAAKVASLRALHRTSAKVISAGKRCSAVRPNPILGGLLAATIGVERGNICSEYRAGRGGAREARATRLGLLPGTRDAGT